MQVTIDIPEPVVAQLTAAGKDPARVTLESLALEGYRNGFFSEAEIAQALGYESRFQVWELLAAHRVPRQYSLQDWEHDKQAADEAYRAQTQGDEDSPAPAA